MKGTPAETYLRNRGCCLPSSEDLRYEPRAWHWKAQCHAPAIVSKVTDFRTNEPMTCHLTFITEDGRPSPLVPRKMLAPGDEKRGGVIRLTDDADVTVCLGLAEGIETALTIGATGWGPVWATIDAGNMANLPVVPGVEALTIFADNDSAGIKAAQALARRWVDAGREARIALAPAAGTDWNDHAA